MARPAVGEVSLANLGSCLSQLGLMSWLTRPLKSAKPTWSGHVRLAFFVSCFFVICCTKYYPTPGMLRICLPLPTTVGERNRDFIVRRRVCYTDTPGSRVVVTSMAFSTPRVLCYCVMCSKRRCFPNLIFRWSLVLFFYHCTFLIGHYPCSYLQFNNQFVAAVYI